MFENNIFKKEIEFLEEFNEIKGSIEFPESFIEEIDEYFKSKDFERENKINEILSPSNYSMNVTSTHLLN